MKPAIAFDRDVDTLRFKVLDRVGQECDASLASITFPEDSDQQNYLPVDLPALGCTREIDIAAMCIGTHQLNS